MNNTSANTIATKEAVSCPQDVIAKSSNALVHGIYASDLVLPWESEEDLEQLHKDLVTEWTPEGRLEEETVLDLTRLRWRKHRVMRSSQMAVRNDPLVTQLEASGVESWSDAMNFLKAKGSTDDRVMDEAQSTLEELKKAVKNASEMMTVKDKNTQEIYSKIEFIESMFNKHVMPVYQKAFEKVFTKDARPDGTNLGIRNPINVVEAVYCPSYLERILKLEASLDTRIDKTLNRLTTLKEYKRFAKPETPKQIGNS